MISFSRSFIRFGQKGINHSHCLLWHWCHHPRLPKGTQDFLPLGMSPEPARKKKVPSNPIENFYGYIFVLGVWRVTKPGRQMFVVEYPFEVVVRCSWLPSLKHVLCSLRECSLWACLYRHLRSLVSRTGNLAEQTDWCVTGRGFAPRRVQLWIKFYIAQSLQSHFFLFHHRHHHHNDSNK